MRVEQVGKQFLVHTSSESEGKAVSVSADKN